MCDIGPITKHRIVQHAGLARLGTCMAEVVAGNLGRTVDYSGSDLPSVFLSVFQGQCTSMKLAAQSLNISFTTLFRFVFIYDLFNIV